MNIVNGNGTSTNTSRLRTNVEYTIIEKWIDEKFNNNARVWIRKYEICEKSYEQFLFYPKCYPKCLPWSLTGENSFLKQEGTRSNEVEIYLKNLFITGKTLWSDAHIFFLHSQTSNVTQAKLKLLFHECNNLFDSSTVQHPRVCRTNSFYFYFYSFYHWNVKTSKKISHRKLGKIMEIIQIIAGRVFSFNARLRKTFLKSVLFFVPFKLSFVENEYYSSIRGVGNGSKFPSKNSRWLVRRREREKKGRKNLVEFQLDPIERQDENFFSGRGLENIGGVISAFFQAKTRIKR